jgi:hypothetical protein
MKIVTLIVVVIILFGLKSSGQQTPFVEITPGNSNLGNAYGLGYRHTCVTNNTWIGTLRYYDYDIMETVDGFHTNTALHLAVNNGAWAIKFPDDEVTAVHANYTQFGYYSPKIKTKLITGITPNGSGATPGSSPLHGLNASKIISFRIVIDAGGGNYVPEESTILPGYKASVHIDQYNFIVSNSLNSSFNIFNKPFKIFITYEQ